MKKATLILRFSVLCLVALAMFGLGLGYVVTRSIEHNMVTRSQRSTAAFVSWEVAKEFTAADFAAPKLGPDYDVFSEKVSRLYFGPDVLLIKVWNRDHVVVWSDNRQLAGRAFAASEELAEALRGEVTSVIGTPDEDDGALERRAQKLLTLYVPMRFGPDGEVAAVFEIQRELDPLYADIARYKRIVWGLLILGFALLYAVLYGVVHRATIQIRGQTRYITRAAERYRGLVASAYDGVISVDRDGQVILFNDAAARMFGYSPKEVIAHPLTMLLPEEYREEHQTGIRRFYDADEDDSVGRTLELEGVRRNGQRFPMELSLSVSGEGDRRIVTGFLRDVSESRAMQEHLIQTEKQASVSVAAGSFGQELGRSIDSLMGCVGLLIDDPGNKDLAQRCAEAFGRQTERLRLHAGNLIALSEQPQLQMKPIDVAPLIDRVTRTLYVRGVLRMYSIAKDYAEGLPQVRGDETLLEQVIRNLDISASHGMPDDGVLTLSAHLSEDRSHVEFSISGTGGGIPGDAHDRIFLPSFTTPEGKAVGLGMYVVQRVVEQHNGYIRVETKEGGDKVMIIGLPVAA